MLLLEIISAVVPVRTFVSETSCGLMSKRVQQACR